MRTKKLYILLLLVLFPTVILAGGNKETDTQVASVSNLAEVGENWNFSWEFINDEIEFTVTAPTQGWVAIGFNPSRMMKDAQLILGYVSEGRLVMRDDYGIGNTSHASDDSVGGKQNVRPISGTEENGITTIVFALPQDSGDQFDVAFIEGSSYKIILAYGANNADNFTSVHRGRTSVDIVLK